MSGTLAHELAAVLDERDAKGQPLYSPRQRADVLAVALMMFRPSNVDEACLMLLGEFGERAGANAAATELGQAAAINAYLEKNPVPERLRVGLQRVFSAASARCDSQTAVRDYQRFIDENRQQWQPPAPPKDGEVRAGPLSRAKLSR